jgi:putative transposase
VQSAKRECLDHFIVFGEGHLRYLLKEYLSYFHQFRPHQGIGNVLLDEHDKSPPELSDVVPLGNVTCHESLGGLLKHYERKVA